KRTARCRGSQAVLTRPAARDQSHPRQRHHADDVRQGPRQSIETLVEGLTEEMLAAIELAKRRNDLVVALPLIDLRTERHPLRFGLRARALGQRLVLTATAEAGHSLAQALFLRVLRGADCALHRLHAFVLILRRRRWQLLGTK